MTKYLIVATADNGNCIIRHTFAETYEVAYTKSTEMINELDCSVENLVIVDVDNIREV